MGEFLWALHAVGLRLHQPILVLHRTLWPCMQWALGNTTLTLVKQRTVCFRMYEERVVM